MTARFLVTGLVQGVGFRWFVLRAARELGIVGFARNLADGRVEVVARGEADQLAALEARLREGPPQAQVRSLTREALQDDAGRSGFSAFEIR